MSHLASTSILPDELMHILAQSTAMVDECVAQREECARIHAALASSDPSLLASALASVEMGSPTIILGSTPGRVLAHLGDGYFAEVTRMDALGILDRRRVAIDDTERKLRTRIRLLTAARFANGREVMALAAAAGAVDEAYRDAEAPVDKIYNEEGLEVVDIREEYVSDDEADNKAALLYSEDALEAHSAVKYDAAGDDHQPDDCSANVFLSSEDTELVTFLKNLRFESDDDEDGCSDDDSDDGSDDGYDSDDFEFDEFNAYPAPFRGAEEPIGKRSEDVPGRKRVRFSGQDEIKEIPAIDTPSARASRPKKVHPGAIVGSVVEHTNVIQPPAQRAGSTGLGGRRLDPSLDITQHMQEVAVEYVRMREKMVQEYTASGFPRTLPGAPTEAELAGEQNGDDEEDEWDMDGMLQPAKPRLQRPPDVVAVSKSSRAAADESGPGESGKATKRVSKFKAMRQRD